MLDRSWQRRMELAELLSLGRRTEYFFFVNKVISYDLAVFNLYQPTVQFDVSSIYETEWRSVDLNTAVDRLLFNTFWLYELVAHRKTRYYNVYLFLVQRQYSLHYVFLNTFTICNPHRSVCLLHVCNRIKGFYYDDVRGAPCFSMCWILQ